MEIKVNLGRKLSMENAKRIGGGAASDVYQLDEETVVKVLKTSRTEEAEREILLSKWAFKKGIPTAISYDVVDVDGHPGLVYESLGRGNLRNLLRDHPENFDSIMRRYVDLLHTINSVVVDENQLPDAKLLYTNALEDLRSILDAAEYDRMKLLLDTIPESRKLVHGDCQVKNVRVVKGEFLLIDLDTLSCGDPIFELAALYCCYKAYSEQGSGEFDPFFELPFAVEHKMLDAVFQLYCGEISVQAQQENRTKTALLAYLYMASLGKQGELWEGGAEMMLRNFRACLPLVNDLRLTYSE